LRIIREKCPGHEVWRCKKSSRQAAIRMPITRRESDAE
jgi:hypothetical protein